MELVCCQILVEVTCAVSLNLPFILPFLFFIVVFLKKVNNNNDNNNIP